MKRTLIFSTFALVAVLAVAGLMPTSSLLSGNEANSESLASGVAPATIFPKPAFAALGGEASIADIAESTTPSVVNIATTKTIRTSGGFQGSPLLEDPFFRRFFGPQQPQRDIERKAHSLGSGVIVSEDGTILTNNHVVENADSLTVTLQDKRSFEAEIVGTDPETDLAVIRIIEDVSGLTPMRIGNSDALRLGDVVLAIGSPFGLSHTVTMGIVSAKGRTQHITDYEDFIQTDAAINPGNSGGALVAMSGELVGINTAIMSRSGGSQGIGFAIPSNMARMVMEQLMEDGKVVRGWLGVNIQDLTPEIAAAANIKSDTGALVADVLKDGPAEKAGLKAGDVILSIDGDTISDSNDLRNTVTLLGADKKVSIEYLRNGRRGTLRLTLGERPGQAVLASSSGGHRAEKAGGVSVAPLSDELRKNYGIADAVTSGVVVVDLDPGSSDTAGLRPGDVILEVNQKTVESVEDFKRLYEDANKTVLLYVYRDGSRFFNVVKKK